MVEKHIVPGRNSINCSFQLAVPGTKPSTNYKGESPPRFYW